MAGQSIAKKRWILTVIVIFFIPILALSQNKPNENIEKSGKTKRILYGLASFYSNKFNGRKTANGDIFSQKKLTCACNALPLGIWIKVTNMRNGRSVIVKINDRIHPKVRRVVDLSRLAAEKLNFISRGLTRVKVEVIGPNLP